MKHWTKAVAEVQYRTGVGLIMPIQRFFRRETFRALKVNHKILLYKWYTSTYSMLLYKHCSELTVLHVYGFSPVCDLRCLRSAPFDGNDFSHKSHKNGFSPVCVRIWMLHKNYQKIRLKQCQQRRLTIHTKYLMVLTWAATSHKTTFRNVDTDNLVCVWIGRCARANAHANYPYGWIACRTHGMPFPFSFAICRSWWTANGGRGDICAWNLCRKIGRRIAWSRCHG